MRKLIARLFGGGRPSLGRDIIVLDLEHAMRQGGCPVCRIAREADERYIWFFLHENAGDPIIREVLYAALGFCPRHTWIVRDREQDLWGDGLGTAIVLEDVLRVVDQRLSVPGPQRFGVLAPRALCPACAARQRSERTNLTWLVRHLARPEFRALYRQCGGLCLPHLSAAVSPASTREAALFLAEVADETFRALGEPHAPAASRTDGVEALVAWLYGSRAMEAPYGTAMPASNPEGAPAAAEANAGHSEPCPVCAPLLNAGPRVLAALLDAAEERPEPAAGGAMLCARHAALLVRLLEDPSAGTSASRVLQTQVRQAQWKLAALRCRVVARPDRGGRGFRETVTILGERLREAVSGGSADSSAPDEEVSCPACAYVSREIDTSVRHLGESLGKTREHAQFEAGGIICIPHLRAALGTLHGEPSDVLAEVTRAKLEGLRGELREYIRKHAWEYRGEPKGAEQTSWTRATRAIAGERLAW